MNRIPALFLQAVIVLGGIGILALILWEPHIEGRNVHASLSPIYFDDPFLACAYIAFIPVFVALYQAFTLLGQVRKNKIFSSDSVKAVRTIKLSAIVFIGFLLAAEVYFFVVVRGQDDIAGGVAICLFLILVSAIVAAAASVFETTLQNTLNITPDA